MNYSTNYLNGANLLDCELEQFNYNPTDFVASMGWTKDNQAKAEKLKDKITLNSEDYLGLEKLIDSLDGAYDHDDVQDHVTNLFAGKINNLIKKEKL
jgi:hypothetical protein